MFVRAIVVWCGILLLAIANGALRSFWIIPQTGETIGRAVSTLLLCGLILYFTWISIRWIGPSSTGQALTVGILWLCLTLAFEFLVGHYVSGNAWSDLLADYDVTRGRIWILVLVFTLLAPLWTARLRNLFVRPAPS
jgi:hypothetical protein